MLIDLIGPLFIGFVGSLHCLGMCGPLILAYSLHMHTPNDRKTSEISGLWRQGLAHHAAFHLGRLVTYGLLGALAAGFFHLAGFQASFSGLRGNLTLGGGILMVLFGLALLKILPARVFPVFVRGAGSFWGRLIPPLFRSPGRASKLALGLAAGFLPCMLSWAMIVKAATAPNPLAGFLTMISFGAGTIPVLFLTGLPASFLSLRVKIFGERVAALSVLAMGFILIFKGVRYFV